MRVPSILASTLTLLAFANLTPIVDAAVLHVPIERMHTSAAHPRVWEQEFPLAMHLEMLQQQQAENVGTQLDQELLDDDNHHVAEIKLYNQQNFLYAGYISVGTPPQKVRVVFDTSGADLWILNRPNNFHHYYNHSASTTFKGDNKEIPYYDVTALVSTDRIAFGEDDAVVVPEQTFLEGPHPPFMGTSFRNLKFDGFFGLGLAPRSNTTKSATLMHTLVENGLLDEPVVAINTAKDANGHLTLGGVNSAYFTGPIKYIDAIPGRDGKKENWIVPLDDIRVGDSVVASKSNMLIVTGFLLLYGPTKQVDTLAASLGARHSPYNTYLIPCKSSKAHDITLTLGGNKVVFTKEDYIGPQVSAEDCALKIYGMDIDDWTVGEMLLQKYYTVFHYGFGSASGPRVGFATLP